MLENGDFSAGTTPWVVAVSGGAPATFLQDAGRGKIDIASAGPAKADIQLQQGLFADLAGGAGQVLSFDARSASGRLIDVVVHDASGGVLWSKTDISTGVSLASHEYAFTLPATHTGAYLAFHVGGHAADVWLDDISLAPSGKLTWVPPFLDNPVSINLGATNAVPALSAGTDYLITLPAVKRTARVQIQGGRNVVIVGGHVELSSSNNAFYVLEGDPGRVVHIEGCLVTHTATGEGDAVSIAAPSTIVQVQNFRAEHLQGAGDSNHADVIQPWGGSLALRVDRLSGSSNYQGFFLIANYNSNTVFDFRNVNLVIEPEWYPGASGGDIIWLDRGLSGSMGGPVPTEFVNVHAEIRAGDTLPYAVAPSPANTDPAARPVLADQVLTWPGLGFVTGGIHDGPPPGGDYVPAGTAGIGYVSPGYVELAFEVENIASVTASDTVRLVAEVAANGGLAEKLEANAIGDQVTYTLPDVPPGVYDVVVRGKNYSSRGRFQLSIDGMNQGGEQDQYAATTGYSERALGTKTFTTSGAKDFTFTVTGKNAASPGYSLMFDTIALVPRLPTIHFHEVESATLEAASPSVSTITESAASGGQVHRLNATTTGHFVRYTLGSVPAGTHRIKVGIKTANTRGKFQLTIDGANQGAEQDNYNSAAFYTELDLGEKTFATGGDRDFTFTVTGKNVASGGHQLVIDYIKLQ
ncbi:MAG: hypothetical protein ABII82_13045 [Verrucomicrobiota bacterium]